MQYGESFDSNEWTGNDDLARNTKRAGRRVMAILIAFLVFFGVVGLGYALADDANTCPGHTFSEDKQALTAEGFTFVYSVDQEIIKAILAEGIAKAGNPPAEFDTTKIVKIGIAHSPDSEGMWIIGWFDANDCDLGYALPFDHDPLANSTGQ